MELRIRELGRGMEGNHMMAAAEARGMWQRALANRHIVREDVLRSAKFSHFQMPRIVSKLQPDTCNPAGHCYLRTSSYASAATKVDNPLQFSPRDESLISSFPEPGLQSLAEDRNYLTSNGQGLMVAASDCNSAPELELGWQLIVDPQLKPNSQSRICEEDYEVSSEETETSNTDYCGLRKTQQQVAYCEKGAAEIMTSSERNGSRDEFGLDVEQAFSPTLEAVIQEVYEYQESSCTSSMQHSFPLQSTDTEASTGPLARGSMQCLENCDLPSPQIRSKVSLASLDISSSTNKRGGISRSLLKDLLGSLLRGNEPARLENWDLPSNSQFLDNFDHNASGSMHLQRVPQSPTMSSSEASFLRARGSHSFSVNSSWNGGAVEREGSDLLGEALCRSQTRAREAEKKVQQAYEEKERLLHLYFKEASLLLTYRRLVTSLQAENTWLRMYVKNEDVAWLQQRIFDPLLAWGCLSSQRSKHLAHGCYPPQEMDHSNSIVWPRKDLVCLGNSNDIMMECTLGLAFALGLSLAGAGLMLGWSMGWILVAY